MKKAILLAGVACALLMSGCSTKLGHLSVAAADNVNNLQTTKSDSKNIVEGDSCIRTFVIIPTGEFEDRVELATRDAIKNGKDKGIEGDILVDTDMDVTSWSIPFIYGQNCVNVKGHLVKVEK